MVNKSTLVNDWFDNATVLWIQNGTAAIKINRPGHNICMYWTNFWQPTVHVQQNIFKKTLIEVGSPHLYASFGTFCPQIGQLLVNFLIMSENRLIAVIEGKCHRFRNSCESLKTYCAANNWLIWGQKVPKEA